MQKSILKIENLSHKYSTSWAIKDINFEIRQNGIVGLLGSNGAGKSTTMNIVCGVLKQTEGNVFINGIDLKKNPEKAKRIIGFLPQNPPLHLDLTVDEYLTHCAHLRLVERRKIPYAVEAVKEKCGITHFSKRLIRNLSGGYRQRVGIAQAIIHKPLLVVLDEPTNGLDPNQIYEVRKLIKEIATEQSIIFSSHILSEIQATCKDIKMIERGSLIFSDTMEAFNNYIKPNSMIVTVMNPPSEDQLTSIPGITKAVFLNDNNIRLQFDSPTDITERIVKLSVDNGWHLREISLEKSSLDEIFARLSQKLAEN